MKHTSIGKLITALVLFVLVVWTLFPIYWMVNTSFKPDAEIYSIIPTFWPEKFTFGNYVKLVQSNFFSYVKNSLFVSGTVTVLDRPAGAAALRASIGYATQSAGVLPSASTRISLGPAIMSMPTVPNTRRLALAT